MQKIIDAAEDRIDDDADLRLKEQEGGHYEVEVNNNSGNWKPIQVFLKEDIEYNEDAVEAIVAQIRYLTKEQ